jgi:hypothetical protein
VFHKKVLVVVKSINEKANDTLFVATLSTEVFLSEFIVVEMQLSVAAWQNA